MNIRYNGTYYPDAWSTLIKKVVVNVPRDTFTTKSITSNGTYYASSDQVDGYSSVTVNVPQSTLTTKTLTSNGTFFARADGYDGWSSVEVNVPKNVYPLTNSISYTGFTQPSNNNSTTNLQDLTFNAENYGYNGFSTFTYSTKIQYKTITSNGTYYPTDSNTAIRKVVVNVKPNVNSEEVYIDYDRFNQPSNDNTTTSTQSKTYNASSYLWDGFSSFQYRTRIQYKTITSNGTYYPTDDNTAIRKVVVNVSPSLTTKTITSNGTYSASNDGYQGYSSVTVSGIPTIKNIWKVIMGTSSVFQSFSDGTSVTSSGVYISSGYIYTFYNQTDNLIKIIFGRSNSWTETNFVNITNWKYLRYYYGSNVTSNLIGVYFYDNDATSSSSPITSHVQNSTGNYVYSFNYDLPMYYLKISSSSN